MIDRLIGMFLWSPRPAVRSVGAFMLGAREFCYTWTWADPARTDDEPYTTLDMWYDRGREFAHRATFRRFDL